MSFKPSIIAFDVETSGLDYWSPDFRVLSAAFAWRDENGNIATRFVEGRGVPVELKRIAKEGTPLVVHNYGYEWGVLKFKDYDFENLVQVDTMRLCQVYDNNGPELDINRGSGLATCTQRILGRPDPKAKFYQWLQDNGVKKGTEGANLDKLPPDMFEAYNIQDAVETLRLYEHTTQYFDKIGYDWRLDHELYKHITRRVALAQAKGIKVDQSMIAASLSQISNQICDIDNTFKTRFKAEIGVIEAQLRDAWVGGVKTSSGKERRAQQPEKWSFNLRSRTQLEALFVDQLGCVPQFHTPKGNPSFKASHLPSYGEGGEILATRGSKLLTQTQLNNLAERSTGGRWHVSLRTCGTATGRLAGAGGLNIQGLARRDPLLMECMVADPGHTFVSVDLSSGEPTATTHYSNDRNYYDANFGMVGKRPYFDDKSVLKIDDIYLTAASFSPMGASAIHEVFNTTYSGTHAFDVWVEDADLIKNELKSIRALHKILVLGIGYGMTPKKMVVSCYDKGFSITHPEAKNFYNAYWAWCPGVRKLASQLARVAKNQGYLVNDFGYRLLPDAKHKAINYWIQSTVSGIMNVLDSKFAVAAPYARFVTIIHDEIIYQIPDNRLAEAKSAMQHAVESLNKNLGWSVKIRTGWKEGKDLYSAK